MSLKKQKCKHCLGTGFQYTPTGKQSCQYCNGAGIIYIVFAVIAALIVWCFI